MNCKVCAIQRCPLWREMLGEFFGCFMLLMFGMGSSAQFVLSRGEAGSILSVNWAWGLGVTFGVYVSGEVSGGHINPAVTVAHACFGRFSWRKVPMYILAQYLGCFVASLCVYVNYMDALYNFDGGSRNVVGVNATAKIWSTYPQPHVSTWNAFGDQVIGTAILLICILAVTDKHSTEIPAYLAPISIGLSVVAIGMSFGYNCGYAINPARDLAPRFFTFLAGWGDEPFRNYNWFWVPVIGPHIGAIVGSFAYYFLVSLHWPVRYTVKQIDLEMKKNDTGGYVNEAFSEQL